MFPCYYFLVISRLALLQTAFSFAREGRTFSTFLGRASSGEEEILALARAGRNNDVGRKSRQLCADVQTAGYSGYINHDGLAIIESPACIVDDPSGSDVAQWLGYTASDRALPVPPPWDPATGQPARDFPRALLQCPKAVAILEVRNGAVFDCEGGGTVFNSSLAMRLSRWYYRPPPPLKPPNLKVKRLEAPEILSLCVAYGHSFQHAGLDMVPKLSMLIPFLAKHPGAKV